MGQAVRRRGVLLIDVEPFRPLYDEMPSRHNTPANVVIGRLVLKGFFRLMDDKL